jgi:ABC-type lipopolysaccharide export system ATPase subunit
MTIVFNMTSFGVGCLRRLRTAICVPIQPWMKPLKAPLASSLPAAWLTVLMAEQNFRQAIRIADRGYVFVHGQIVLSANNPQALQQNELIRRFYLGVG